MLIVAALTIAAALLFYYLFGGGGLKSVIAEEPRAEEPRAEEPPPTSKCCRKKGKFWNGEFERRTECPESEWFVVSEDECLVQDLRVHEENMRKAAELEGKERERAEREELDRLHALMEMQELEKQEKERQRREAEEKEAREKRESADRARAEADRKAKEARDAELKLGKELCCIEDRNFAVWRGYEPFRKRAKSCGAGFKQIDMPTCVNHEKKQRATSMFSVPSFQEGMV
jgi:hypothetical protein